MIADFDTQAGVRRYQQVDPRTKLDHAEAIGLGSQNYELIEFNPSNGVVSDHQNIPSKIKLNPAYPNPFNSSTTLSYSLDSASFVDLSIYNLRGQLVDCICKEKQNPGPHSYQWNPHLIGSGIYLIRLTADKYTDIKRCIYSQ